MKTLFKYLLVIGSSVVLSACSLNLPGRSSDSQPLPTPESTPVQEMKSFTQKQTDPNAPPTTPPELLPVEY